MADQTAVIVGVLVAIVVSVLALVIVGFWIYLCCGKHKDLIWKRYEPDPVPPQRPLKVTISAGVVTIDSAMGSVNDINQDEISLQPSIAPIAKRPTVRKNKLFSSQPELGFHQELSHSLGRMMESEPASHYQLSIDENDELLVDQGMFELHQEIEEYDSEPRPFKASSYPEVHESSQEGVELEAIHLSSPVILDPIGNGSSPVRTHSMMQSESRDADLELESSNESMKNSEKTQADSKEVDENIINESETKISEEIVGGEANEQESAGRSSRNDSQTNSKEDLNSEKSSASKSGGTSSDKTSIHSDSQSVEDAVKDEEENETNIEEIETVLQDDPVTVMEPSTAVDNESPLMEANDQSGDVKDSDKDDSSDDKGDEEKLSANEEEMEKESSSNENQSQSSFQEDVIGKKESDDEENEIAIQPKTDEEEHFVKDINETASVASQSSASDQESQKKDDDDEQTDSSNSDTKFSSDVSTKSNPDTKQDNLVETSSLSKVSDLKEIFQKIGNSPSSSPASNTKYKPLTYQKQNVLQSGFDASGSESSLDDSPNDNSPPTQRNPEESLTAGRPKFNLSGNEQTKQNNQGISSLATVTYKAPLPNLSTSDNESESEVNLATTEVQTIEPKLAIHVVADSEEVDGNTVPPPSAGVQTQPIRKRKQTPAIMDPMVVQQQLLQQLSVGSTKTNDRSLGSIAEGIIEEEEEEESDDEGNTRF